jgi:hypothetical protein
MRSRSRAVGKRIESWKISRAPKIHKIGCILVQGRYLANLHSVLDKIPGLILHYPIKEILLAAHHPLTLKVKVNNSPEACLQKQKAIERTKNL